jgi:hypothetical protein
MHIIRSSLTVFVAERGAELALVEPRLAEHDNRAEAVRCGLPMQHARAVQEDDDEWLQS